MNPIRVQICSLMVRKRLTVEAVVEAIDPHWKKHYGDIDIAFDKLLDKAMLETVRGL